MRTNNKISKEIVNDALEMMCIDEKGLDEMDKKILRVMIDYYDGGPVGLNTISSAVGEPSDTIEEVNEPYLILLGLIKRTPRGREVTSLAREYMKNQKPHYHQC
jgi:Holliday junction DNA helicase RuvB